MDIRQPLASMTKSSSPQGPMAATGGSWRALLLLCLMVFTRAAGAKKTTITPAPSGPTAVPIFLPDVPGTQWSEWRGSIISSNNVGTVYSVFCAPDRIGCSIAGDDLVPFRFTEGPGTLNVADTIAGLITVTQACDLTSTTAATCSGSTFVAAALTASLGPLLSNTSVAPYTLTGTSAAASWGVLTLGDAPLTRTKGGRTYTYYTTSTTTTATATATATAATGSESIPATTTTGQTAIGAGAGAGSASTSTRAAGGGSGSGSGSGSGGGSGSGSGSRGGKGHPKKSGASMRVEVQGVLGAGAVLAGLVVVLL